MKTAIAVYLDPSQAPTGLEIYDITMTTNFYYALTRSKEWKTSMSTGTGCDSRCAVKAEKEAGGRNSPNAGPGCLQALLDNLDVVVLWHRELVDGGLPRPAILETHVVVSLGAHRAICARELNVDDGAKCVLAPWSLLVDDNLANCQLASARALTLRNDADSARKVARAVVTYE